MINMDKVAVLTLLVTVLCHSQSAKGSGCSFVSEDKETCYMKVKCSTSTAGISNAINGQYCSKTERVSQTKHDSYYGHYRNEYTSRYVRDFKLDLSIDNIEDSGLFQDLDELTNRVKILRLYSANNFPLIVYYEKIKIFIKLNEIEIQSQLNLLDIHQFLVFQEIQKINVSYNSISVLEMGVQETIQKSSTVQAIDLSHNLIEEIPNNYFSHFAEVRHLNLSHNNFKSFEILTFEGLLKLETLQLSCNQLIEIGHSFARFINLKELSVDNNELNSIMAFNFKTMTGLLRLNMSSNRISLVEDQSFETLTKLIEVDLGNNKISLVSKLWFASNINLQTVILRNNSIKRIEPSAFKYNSITQFDIANNCLNGELEPGTFEGIHVPRLDLSKENLTLVADNAFQSSYFRSLTMSSNAITSIRKTAFGTMDMIEELDLSNNFLKDIDFDMVESGKLSVFDARNNSIEKITRSIFKNLSSLTSLDLSHNLISNIETHSFINLGKLKILTLNNNALPGILESKIFQGLSDLTHMNLAFTKIFSFCNETFSGLENLKLLNVSHSQLTNVTYNAFLKTGSMKIIDFSYNLLVFFHVNISTINGIQEIYLNNNNLIIITDETFSGLNSLQILNLAENNIAKVENRVFDTLGNLMNLDMSFNMHLSINGSVFNHLTKLTKVAMSNIKENVNFEYASNASIEVMDLSQGNIKDINKICIFKLVNVESLSLAKNKIGFLDKFSFQAMPVLTWLDLSDNLITFIQPGTFIYTNQIINLNLHGNQLAHLQFGVFDDLKFLHTLNLSSNALREFSSNLLHNTPRINTIILDNNALEDFRFADFAQSSIKVISIGGNPIACHVFTEMKKNFSSYGFQKVTAEQENLHSENVEGITCRSNTVSSKIWLANDTNINSTIVISALSNALDSFRVSIEELSKNINGSLENKPTDTNENTSLILKSIEYLLEQNNESQVYLKQLTDMSKITNNYLNTTNNYYSGFNELLKNLTLINSKKSTEKYIFVKTNDTKVVDDHLLEKIKILNEEKEKIVDELKEMIGEFSKESALKSNAQASNNTTNEYGDIRGILCFMAVCFSIVIIGFIFKLSYQFFLSKNTLARGNGLHSSISSTQPISNIIEMQ